MIEKSLGNGKSRKIGSGSRVVSCPNCGDKTSVYNTRGNIRERICTSEACDYFFSTHEITTEEFDDLVKKVRQFETVKGLLK